MTARHPRRLLGAIAMLLCCLVITTCFALPAQAGDAGAKADDEARAEASERFRRGVELYKSGDFVAALVEFKRAYELEPNYRVLYNLGQTSRELKDYAAALIAYERYLDEGGKKISRGRKKEVRRAIDDLTDRVGTLTITTNAEGAEIQIDDVVVGTSPLDEAMVVNVGRRRVAATLEGHAPARRVVEVAGGDELEVELALADLKADRPPPPPPPPPPPRQSPKPGAPVAGIVALSITGAAAIATGVVGGLALSARGELDDALAAFPGSADDIRAAQGKTATLATVTDVMVGVTGAGAVTTLVLFLLSSGSDSEAEPGADEGTGRGRAQRVHVAVTPTAGGVWLRGSF